MIAFTAKIDPGRMGVPLDEPVADTERATAKLVLPHQLGIDPSGHFDYRRGDRLFSRHAPHGTNPLHFGRVAAGDFGRDATRGRS